MGCKGLSSAGAHRLVFGGQSRLRSPGGIARCELCLWASPGVPHALLTSVPSCPGKADLPGHPAESMAGGAVHQLPEVKKEVVKCCPSPAGPTSITPAVSPDASFQDLPQFRGSRVLHARHRPVRVDGVFSFTRPTVENQKVNDSSSSHRRMDTGVRPPPLVSSQAAGA